MPGRVELHNLEEVMTYHAPDEDQTVRYKKIAAAATLFAATVLEFAPECADRSTAVRKIREARMDANSAIALRGLI